jgi:hypothetical protein
MSKPIHSIHLDEIDQAAKIMVDRNIRHLPVWHLDEETGDTLVSMVSMRDVLRNLVHERETGRGVPPRPVHAGMISQSKGMRALLRKISAQHGDAAIETLEFDRTLSGQAEKIEKLDVLFFDLDHIEAKVWANALKELNAHPHHPEVILLYDPDLHEESELEVLAKIGLSGRFSDYTKPLNFFVLVNRLHLADR